MNGPAERLCKCLEGLRDIQEGIEQYNAVTAPKKQRRRLRGIVAPLHALCIGIVDLINCVQSEKSVHSHLPPGGAKDLTALRERFELLVPFGRKGKLGVLRNKVSTAHYDKDLSSAEMRELLKNVASTEVGEWISICLGTLCDMLKLNVYKWSTEPPCNNTAVILCEETIPVMSVLDVDVETKKITGFKSIYLTKSPRVSVFETIKEVAEYADTLYTQGVAYRFRISNFYEDPPEVGWSAILRSTKSEPDLDLGAASTCTTQQIADD